MRERAEQLAAIPLSQLAAMKLIVNQAYENMGLASTQVLGPILDGLMRNTPDAQRVHRARRARGRRRGRGASATARSATTARRRPRSSPNPDERDRALTRMTSRS